LAPRFEFKPKHPNNQPTPGFDYGEAGYDPNRCNVGVGPGGIIQLEIKGLAVRSLSDHPFVAENRAVIHKIGVTGGDVKARVANAKKEPTYLLADVEIVTTFKLANIKRKQLEKLLHRFFSSARLEIELMDRFGNPVEPQEWFLVPLEVIEEVVEKIRNGTIDQFRYDRETASLAKDNLPQSMDQ